MSANKFTLQSLVERLWIAPENAERTPKITVVPLSELQLWMASDDIEVLGYVNSVIHESRFRIEPPLSISDYVSWVKHYCGHRFRKQIQIRKGVWSNCSPDFELARIFILLWDDETVPRSVLRDIKSWIAETYKIADERLRWGIVHGTLEHLFERKPIRQYYSDWQLDSELGEAYGRACRWRRFTVGDTVEYHEYGAVCECRIDAYSRDAQWEKVTLTVTKVVRQPRTACEAYGVGEQYSVSKWKGEGGTGYGCWHIFHPRYETSPPCDSIVEKVAFEHTTGLSSEQETALKKLLIGRRFQRNNTGELSKAVYRQLRVWGFEQPTVYDPDKGNIRVLDESGNPSPVAVTIDVRLTGLDEPIK